MVLRRLLLILGVTASAVALTWAFAHLCAHVGRGRRSARRIAPWTWLGPALAVVLVALAYPAIATVVLSTFDSDGDSFVGVDNYRDLLNEAPTLVALRNTAIWTVFLPLIASGLGLLFAVLSDRVSWGMLVRAALFLPIAISAVATGVIWRFFYEYKPSGAQQTGTLNRLVEAFGFNPIAWIIDGRVNNFALVVTAIWTQTGFCTIVFTAALRAIPSELYEAAAIDGATPWRQFRHITLPLLTPTLTIVVSTMAFIALRAFDVIYVMTNGNFDTDVLATLMFKELFSARHDGRAGALAALIMLAVIPILVINVQQYRRQYGRLK